MNHEIEFPIIEPELAPRGADRLGDGRGGPLDGAIAFDDRALLDVAAASLAVTAEYPIAHRIAARVALRDELLDDEIGLVPDRVGDEARRLVDGIRPAQHPN